MVTWLIIGLHKKVLHSASGSKSPPSVMVPRTTPSDSKLLRLNSASTSCVTVGACSLAVSLVGVGGTAGVRDCGALDSVAKDKGKAGGAC